MGEIADEMVSQMLGEGRRPRRPILRHYDVTKILFTRVCAETDKALLLDITGLGETWVPRSIIAAKSAHTAMVHRNVYLQIIGQQRAAVDLLPDLNDEDE